MKKFFAISASTMIALSLVACSSASPSEEVSVVGTWGEPEMQGEPSLTLEDDGQVYGSDGCNRITGSYEHEGTEIEFGALATTMMFCEGVDTWLSTASTASVSADQMQIFDTEGNEIGVLDKQ
ncbi:MAG TPA: META domain-containing protein [Microbacteriaceae bacterium]|nr:META domain-containing protein [Microbacteriaceae bacterium]